MLFTSCEPPASSNKVPSIKILHQMFYDELGKYGHRAHHVKQIYIYAKAFVKAGKKNGGKTPVPWRLTARINKYDYKMNLEIRTLIPKIYNGGEIVLKLLIDRIEKFMS
ncbi:MAG: hypothetical protein QXE81_04750 [Desulfurococcaceae archaeon]